MKVHINKSEESFTNLLHC